MSTKPITLRIKQREMRRKAQAAIASRREARQLRAAMARHAPAKQDKPKAGKPAKLPTLRFTFRGIEDDYLLGIVCHHTGLTETARHQLRGMGEGERARLFAMGLQDAPRCSLADIASELAALRRRQPALFDALVTARMGSDRHAAIVEAAKSYQPHSRRRCNWICDALATFAAPGERQAANSYHVQPNR